MLTSADNEDCTVFVAPDGNIQEVMCCDYGFRSGFGRLYQGGDGEIPKNAFALVRPITAAAPFALGDERCSPAGFGSDVCLISKNAAALVRRSASASPSAIPGCCSALCFCVGLSLQG